MTDAHDRRDQDLRHQQKMAARKAVQDAEVASKSIAEKGLLIVHSGSGKGKTSAAMGLVLRALGYGWPVGIVQFIKGAWDTRREACAGPLRRSRLLAHDGRGVHLGDAGQGTRHRRPPNAPWAKACALMDDPAIRLLVLDELNIALRYDYLPLDAVVARSRGAAPGASHRRHGRNAKPALIEAADLVTEMTLVKHHFAAGVKAQQGIEF